MYGKSKIPVFLLSLPTLILSAYPIFFSIFGQELLKSCIT